MTSPSGATATTRRTVSRGLITVLVALIALAVLGWATARSSMSHGALLGMLPFASVLAIAALGQTLVVMQGGIDLSIAGTVSLTVVIITHEAYGNDGKVLPAAALALAAAIASTAANGSIPRIAPWLMLLGALA